MRLGRLNVTNGHITPAIMMPDLGGGMLKVTLPTLLSDTTDSSTSLLRKQGRGSTECTFTERPARHVITSLCRVTLRLDNNNDMTKEILCCSLSFATVFI